MTEFNIEFEKIPSIIYVQEQNENHKKSFQVYKNGEKLTNVNSISILHNDSDCVVDIKRQVGFSPS